MNCAPPSSASTPRLLLKEVTVCAISSSNVVATICALEASVAKIEVAQTLLFTDADVGKIGMAITDEIQIVPIERLNSSQAYSKFVLEQMADYISTSHCLIVQWDGHVLDALKWRDEFLDYDYIGASWPQFDDGHVVGNGGFSLRSRALIEACRRPDFNAHHPEDIAICRTNRAMLERLGLRFAPVALANQFSAERTGDLETTFGYHGVFLMPRALGSDGFWEVYGTLDDRGTLRHDIFDVLRIVLAGKNGIWRSLKLLLNHLKDRIGRRFLGRSWQ